MRFLPRPSRNPKCSFGFPCLKLYQCLGLFCFFALNSSCQICSRYSWEYRQCPAELAVQSPGQLPEDRCRFSYNFTFYLKEYLYNKLYWPLFKSVIKNKHFYHSDCDLNLICVTYAKLNYYPNSDYIPNFSIFS